MLLDALGTLVELEPPWERLPQTILRRHGVEVSEDEAKRALLVEMAYYRKHHQEGFDDDSLTRLRRHCAEVLRNELSAAAAIDLDSLTEVLLDSLRFSPYPDAAPALAELRAAGMRIAVVSNWDCSLPDILAGVGLAGAVDEVVVSAQAKAAKPDPRIFAIALERLRRRPAEALVVGDSLETDVAGAKAAGIRAALLDRLDVAPDGSGVERITSLSDIAGIVALPSG